MPASSPRWIIGKSLPWSVSWTGEQSFSLRPSRDFPGLTDLVQAEHPGHGVPRFAALHVTRHRRAMVLHLCHVCGKPTHKRDRHIFPVQSGGMAMMPDNTLRYAGNIPPLHLACAERAQRLCPHLGSAYSQPIPMPWEDARLLPRTDVPPGMEELAKSLPPGPRVVFSCYRLYSADFTAKVERFRAEFADAPALETLPAAAS